MSVFDDSRITDDTFDLHKVIDEVTGTTKDERDAEVLRNNTKVKRAHKNGILLDGHSEERQRNIDKAIAEYFATREKVKA